MKNFLIGLGVAVSLVSTTFAQTQPRRPLTPAVPFMTISPDARSSAMGDAGVGSAAYDANALYWNGAKLAFSDKKVGASLSVSPWLTNLTGGDMAFIGLTGYQKLDKNLVIGLMVGYFNSGSIQFTSNIGQPLNTFDSRESYLTGSISRKLTEHFSTGVNIKFVSSNLTGNSAINNVSYSPGRAVAGDLNFFYTNDYRKKNSSKGIEFNWGATITNLGSKISYGTGRANFLPTSLKLGTGLALHLDERNRFNFIVDASKFLIPSEPVRDAQNKIVKGVDPDSRTALSAVVASFGDSPDGAAGEMREINLGGGAEYWYNDIFALRGGYYFQPTSLGSLRYYTVGLGARIKESLGVDFSYLIPSGGSNSPLANTLRISLIYDVAAKKKGKKVAPVEETTEEQPQKN